LLGVDPDPDPEPDAELEPTNDEPGADEADAAAPSEPGEASTPTNTDSSDDGKKKKPRSSGGRTPPPDHLDRSHERHEACACTHCGSDNLDKKDARSSSKLDVQPFFIQIREIDRERYRCGDCGRWTTAEMPPPLG